MINSKVITVDVIEKYWSFDSFSSRSQFTLALQIEGFMEAVNGVISAIERAKAPDNEIVSGVEDSR